MTYGLRTMPGRVAAALVGALVVLTSIGCGSPVELPSHEAHLQPVAPAPTTTVPSTPTTTAPVAPVHPAVASRARPAKISVATPETPTQPGDIFDQLARCESGMHNDTSGPYYGFFQFLPSTWRSIGETGMPYDADYPTQKAAARRLVARSGWGQFPACSRKIGAR